MIKVTNTPNNAGVTIIGDVLDFEELYDALHTIVGDEGQYASCTSARLRVLGLCYDMRHAMMGDREVEFVDNGLDEGMMKRLSVITASNNIYLRIKALWPEMLFICVSLNEFCKLSRRKGVIPEWNAPTAAVRKLQAAVVVCLQEMLPAPTVARMMKLMNPYYINLDRYITQYVDVLNSKYLEMDAEKRLKNISVMAKRLFEPGEEYVKLQQSVLESARHHGCSPDEIDVGVNLPEEEDILW